jgi:hypothetical protein
MSKEGKEYQHMYLYFNEDIDEKPKCSAQDLPDP